MKSAAPKFKGTMLMMNQGAPAPVGGSRPEASPPAATSAPSPKIGPGAPSAGAASPNANRLKGTIVGVAPPMAGPTPVPPAPGTVAFEAPPPGFGAPAPAAVDHHQFGSAQGANPLGATVALDVPLPAFGGSDVGAQRSAGYAAPADPNAGIGSFGAPPANGGFGAPPPNDNFGAPPGGMEGGMGAPYGAPRGPYGGQPGFDPSQPPMGGGPMGGGAMQPYGGAPMGAPGMMPGPMVADAGQKSWMTTLLLAVFVGWLGVHRFYTGHTLFGVLQLVTCGGGGIWQLIDIIFILTGKYTDAQGRPLAK